MSSQPAKRISQTQIAKELGYSQALVSMALNGRKQGISEEAYKRIWEYAITNGYSPRGMNIDSARESSNTTTVGYILRSPLKLANKSNFFNHVHQGMYDQLDQHGVKMVFLGSEDDIQVEKLPELKVMTSSVKGIAIMGEVQPEFLEGVRQLQLPIAYASARATGKCHSVLSNEQESGAMLVNHLYELGHRKFAWLGGDKFMGRHKERFNAVVEGLARYDLSLDPNSIARLKGADRMEGSNAAKQIVETNKDHLPTAWICLNSLMARGAISYLFQNGYRIPEDLSIAAIDMTNVCTEENPQITSASALPEEMGSEAARILLESINGSVKSLMDVTLPTQLRVLDSTGAVKKPVVKEGV